MGVEVDSSFWMFQNNINICSFSWHFCLSQNWPCFFLHFCPFSVFKVEHMHVCVDSLLVRGSNLSKIRSSLLCWCWAPHDLLPDLWRTMPSWEIMCSTARKSCDCKGKFSTAVILVFTFCSSNNNDSEVLEFGGKSGLCCLVFFFQFRALAPMYYRGSAAAIIVYDITKEVRNFILTQHYNFCGFLFVS